MCRVQSRVHPCLLVSPMVSQQPHSDDKSPEIVLSYTKYLLALASYLAQSSYLSLQVSEEA